MIAPWLFTNVGTPLDRVFWANADIVNSDPTKAIAQSVFFTVFLLRVLLSLLRVVVWQNVLRDFFVEDANAHGSES